MWYQKTLSSDPLTSLFLLLMMFCNLFILLFQNIEFVSCAVNQMTADMQLSWHAVSKDALKRPTDFPCLLDYVLYLLDFLFQNIEFVSCISLFNAVYSQMTAVTMRWSSFEYENYLKRQFAKVVRQPHRRSQCKNYVIYFNCKPQ
jgi:hypothetical protein